MRISPKQAPMVILLGSLIGALFVSCVRNDKRFLEKPVLKVNGFELTAQQFADRLAKILKPFDALAAKDKTNVQRSKDAVVREFIIEAVVRDWARTNNVFVKKEELDREIQKIRQNYPDDAAFRRALAEEGATYEDWEEKMRLTLLQRQVLGEVTKTKSAPSESEIQSYYETNKTEFEQPEMIQIRQVVLDNEESAKQVLQEVKGGRKLSDLAKKFSIAPEAAKGGEIGWIEKGTLDIFDKAFNMPKGSKSPILKSPYGFHIYEVVDRRPAKRVSLSEAKEKIVRALLEQRAQVAYTEWLEKEIRKARVYKDEKFIQNMSVETRVE